MEILSNIGLGGNSAVDTYMALVNPEEGLGGFEIGLERCEKMRTNNWIDPDGKFDIQILPVGDYSEVHHSGCYRAFNASREIAAHRYGASAKAPVDPSVWAKMKYELKTGKAGLIRTKKAKQPKNKLVFPKGCAFGQKICDYYFTNCEEESRAFPPVDPQSGLPLDQKVFTQKKKRDLST